MKPLAAALVAIVGALLATWAIQEPGNQFAAALIGGFMFGLGLQQLVDQP